VRDVLGVYQKVYGGGLGDVTLQQDAKGRDKSFQEFAAGKIGILLESDYFWRSVVEPKQGIAPMPNRDQWSALPRSPPSRPARDRTGRAS